MINTEGRKYAFVVMIALAAIMAVTYVVLYVEAGLNSSSNFAGKWYLLVTAVLYAGATLTMPKFGKIGWYLYFVSLIATIAVQMIGFSLENLPMMFMTIFIIIFLLDDSVKSDFGVEFKLSFKL